MKKFQVSLLFLFFIALTDSVYSQAWKQYADSGQVYWDKKDMNKAVELYTKAKEELKKDSALTNRYAYICNVIGVLYSDMGQYAKAEPLLIESKEVKAKVIGKSNLDYAAICNSLCWLYSRMGQYEKAEPICIEAMQAKEVAVGKGHSEYAASCNLLANLYVHMGQFQKAEPLYTEAKEIREKVFGKEHPEYAQTINSLANLARNMGDYEKAKSLFIEAKQIREKTVGREHEDYGVSCVNLATLYYQMGEYKNAELLYLESKANFEKVLGKEHPFYASCCGNLGLLYHEIGNYSKAEPFYAEARQIREKILGKLHPEYAISCNNLANLYGDRGDFEKAEALYLETKQIREKALGKEHPHYAASCTNLASLYWEMGQYDKAELLYNEAIAIQEKILGKDHPAYASSCNNLGVLYVSMNKYDRAEPLYLESKRIREKAPGKDHPDYATSCHNLGELYRLTSQYDKAEAFFLQSKQVREKVLGKMHIDYAQSCHGLGQLYVNIGDYERGKTLLLEAKDIREKVFGKEHPLYIQSCRALANLFWNVKGHKTANDLFAEAIRVQNELVKKVFQFTSETEKMSYINKVTELTNDYLSFNTTVFPHINQGITYDISLANRNLVLSFAHYMRMAIYNTTDTSTRRKYNDWMNLREQLSFWYSKSLTARADYVNVLEVQTNNLEKQLTRLSGSFEKQHVQRNINWKDILENLRANEAAIEFIKFDFYDGKRWTDSTFYAALLLRKNVAEPQLIPLFESRRVAELLGTGNTLNKVTAFYRGDNKEANSFTLIWQPIEKYLKNITRIYYAPAGLLHRIAFAALPVDDRQVLSDKYQLIQLNTTASVVNQSARMIDANSAIYMYGGIKYDVDSSALKHAVAAIVSGNAKKSYFPDDATRGSRWDYLPGTEKEISQITSIGKKKNYEITIASGITASEESIKALNGKSSPSVLHIATHGFFFPDPVGDKKDKPDLSGGGAFQFSDNPLFRSGLLFAGANNTWNGKSFEGLEDGILTAYEVSNLYLPNTKLVVLSACETGLGEVQGNEGVYGLQRSFKMAGVENLVMSLWKVPDKTTAEFMQEFYKGIFNMKSVSVAFQNAQTTMKNKYRKEPYKWAAWVLVR